MSSRSPSPRFRGKIRWKSAMMVVKTDPPKRFHDTDGPLRGKCLMFASFKMLPHPQHIEDKMEILRTMRRLKAKERKPSSPSWRNHALRIPLGPERIISVLRWHSDPEKFRYDLTMHYGDYHLAVFDQHPTVEIQANPVGKYNEKLKMIESALERELLYEQDVETLTSPSADYSIRFEYEKEPELIANCEKSNKLLVIDGPSYRNFDNRSVVSEREIDNLERQYIEERIGSSLPQTKIHLVKFHTSERRNKAACNLGEDAIDVLYSEEMSHRIAERTLCHVVFTEGVEYSPTRIIERIDETINQVTIETGTQINFYSQYAPNGKLLFTKENWSTECTSRFGDEFRVDFKTLKFGMKVLTQILYQLDEGPFQIGKFNPTVIPIYQKSMVISRRMRSVFQSVISRLDEDLIAQPSENVTRARIFENWDEYSAIGEIGVEGWDRDNVVNSFDRLKKDLEPEVVPGSECPELMLGVGELFAYSLANKYRDQLLVDVDKFKKAIYLFGDKSKSAIEDLHSYPLSKSKLEVSTDIPIFPPFFNDISFIIRYEDNLRELEMSRGIYSLYWNEREKLIEFTGTVEAYEMMIEAVGEVSRFVNKRKRGNDGYSAQRHDEVNCVAPCPVCRNYVNHLQDFFRPECGHVVCRECANNKVSSLMTGETASFVLKCDFLNCQKPWSPYEILYLLRGGILRLEERDFTKLELFMTKAKESILTRNVETTRSCPSPDCIGIRRIAESRRARCGLCGKKYCGKCLQKRHRHSCDRNAGLQVANETFEQYRESAGDEMKSCPDCRQGIEKRDGCMHMECRCGCHFCWICLVKYTTAAECIAHIRDSHPSIDFDLLGETDSSDYSDDE